MKVSGRQRRRGWVALAAAMAMTNAAMADTFFEDFGTDSDTRWIGLGNRSSANNNYGWSDTDFTGTGVNPPSGATASGAGEFYGRIQRGNLSSYGFNVGNLTADDTLHADGVYQWIGGAGSWYFGFFNAGSHMDGSEARNFIGLQLDDSRDIYSHVANHTGRERGGRHGILTVGQTVQWSMDFDPTGGPNGHGQLTGFMGEFSFSLNVPSGYKDNWLVMNRFGFFPVGTSDSIGEVAFDDITFTIGEIVTTPPTWNVDSSGDWNAGENWDTGAAPNAPDIQARFHGVISSPRTVFTNTPITLGSLEFDNANTYVLTGAGSLSLIVTTGDAQINAVQGSHNINLPLFLFDNTVATVAGGATLTIADPLTLDQGVSLTKVGDGALDIISTVTTTAASLRTMSGTTNASINLGPNMTVDAVGGTTNLNATQRVAAVSVGTNATVNLTAGGNKTLVTRSLSISGNGKLDLNDNKAVIDYTGSVGSLVEDTRANLAAGRLTSSLATAGMRLGYGDNAVLNKTIFGGESVDASSVLIGFTFAGDTDLDGDVDVADLGNLASAWQTNGVWTGGDFDYSGFIDVNDLGMLASNWQAGVGGSLGPSLAEALAAVGLSSTAVPEPAAATAVGALLLAGFARRRAPR